MLFAVFYIFVLLFDWSQDDFQFWCQTAEQANLQDALNTASHTVPSQMYKNSPISTALIFKEEKQIIFSFFFTTVKYLDV